MGLILAVPITAVIKVICDHVEANPSAAGSA
jgi:predicted PurR-regulated permease PerM